MKRAAGNPRFVPQPDGQVRRSQIITTFGPGAMVDLIDRAVVVGGLDYWSFPAGNESPLDEPRLRSAVLKRLKPLYPDIDLADSHYFRRPPLGDSDSPIVSEGIRVLEFPLWRRCQECKRIARFDNFDFKGGKYFHQCDSRHKASGTEPVRFVTTCKHGHLSDFPWSEFVHRGPRCSAPELYLYEEASGDFTRIRVECKGCGVSRRMSDAQTEAVLPGCKGERPWLGRDATEPCTERQHLLTRTATNGYFSQVMSALRLPPPEPTPEQEALKPLESKFDNVETLEELKVFLKVSPDLRHLRELTAERVWETLQTLKAARKSAESIGLREAEYLRFADAQDEIEGVGPSRNAEFYARRFTKALPFGIKRLVLVHEVREVRVQLSFSRLESVRMSTLGEYDYESLDVRPAPLMLPGGAQKWLPAAQVRGEGFFVELDEEALREWESRPSVLRRARALQAAEEDPSKFRGIRFYLLHSLSHLLLTTISLECGYAASAIRERIYSSASTDDRESMAGFLLMTGTPGAEGTLGGLVEEGRRLVHHLGRAWDLGRLCSNDPVCGTHKPDSDNHDGAACHGCLYIAESSCEWFNRGLDRALVVPVVGQEADLAFFPNKPRKP